jgi:hypothetical protein
MICPGRAIHSPCAGKPPFAELDAPLPTAASVVTPASTVPTQRIAGTDRDALTHPINAPRTTLHPARHEHSPLSQHVTARTAASSMDELAKRELLSSLR